MGENARLFQDFITLALDHPEGPEVARAFDRVLQFELEDEGPFYMEVRSGQLSVEEGDSGLDWKFRDWERVTCVHTTGRVLRDIIGGRRLISEAFFDQQLGFAPRRMADRHISAEAIVAWFYTLVRLAHEQAREVAHRRYVSSWLSEPSLRPRSMAHGLISHSWTFHVWLVRVFGAVPV